MIVVYQPGVEILENGEVYTESVGGSMFIYQVVGWAAFAFAVLLLYPTILVRIWKTMEWSQALIIAIIYLSLILQFWGDSRSAAAGLAYTFVLLATLLLLPAIWSLPREDLGKALAGSAIVLFGFQITSIVVFGWPQGRYVGWIQPNLFGATIISAFVLVQFGTGWIVNVIKVTSFVLAVAVSSRYCIVGCLVADLLFRFTFNKFSTKNIALVVIGVASIALLLHQYESIFAIDDPARGLGSGLTGREVSWASAFEEIAASPFGVGYKRSAVDFAGHNGYLKVMVEFGLIGGAMIIGAILWLTTKAVVGAYLCTGEDTGLRRIRAARGAGLAAFAVASFFQPQLLNVGDAMGIGLLLLLSAPNMSPGFRAQVEANPTGALSTGVNRTLSAKKAGRRF